MRKRIKHAELLLVIAASFLTGLFSFLIYIIQRQGYFTLCVDFDLQQIPFSMALHNVLGEGNLGGWIWNYDLGSSIITAFSFYELGSPFFWITMLFPVWMFPYLVPWIYILKYMTAAVTAFFFLRRFVRSEKYAVVGAILYAFSGFQTVNLLFYHFHDAVAFFPLLLTGVERIAADPKDKCPFIFAVFLNCLVNYFFFIQNVIFLVLYYFMRFWKKDRASGFAVIRSALICGVWGVAMAAVLFLPSILYVLNSSRAGITLHSPIVDPKYFLYVVRGAFFPGEAMSSQSSLYQMEWKSVGCYLPMIGMSLCIPYALKKRDWLRGMLILFLVISLSPLLCAAFVLLTEWYYRWWYMLVMMAALASIRVMEDPKEYNVNKGLVISLAVVIVLYLLLKLVPWPFDGGTLVFDDRKLLIYTGIAFGGIMLTELLYRTEKLSSRWVLLAVCVFSAVTTGLTLHYYGSLDDDQATRRKIAVGMHLEEKNEQYRYTEGDNIYTLTGRAAGIKIFSSTVTAGSKELDSLLGYYSTNLSADKHFYPGLPQLLGGKYTVAFEDPEGEAADVLDVDGEPVYILEQEACPIGFAVTRYVLTDTLVRQKKEDRGKIMLAAAVVDRKDEAFAAVLCAEADVSAVLAEDQETLIAENQARAVTDFYRDSRGFVCRSAFDAPAAVFFSVPYDRGWSAAVDGAPTEIVDSAGMMLIQVPAGAHEIRFTFVTPGYTAGKWISIAACLLYLGYCALRFSGMTVRKLIALRRSSKKPAA